MQDGLNLYVFEWHRLNVYKLTWSTEDLEDHSLEKEKVASMGVKRAMCTATLCEGGRIAILGGEDEQSETIGNLYWLDLAT